MKAISLEGVFSKPTTDISALRSLVKRNRAMSEIRHAIGEVEFDTAYDFLRSTAIEMVERGEIDKAIQGLEEIDALITRSGEEDHHLLDIHAALMQILTALFIEKEDMESAMASAASTLTLLSQEAKRKDEPFLQILGALLYDIAFLHTQRKEYKQAERELSKALKIFERLAKTNPERYASPHLMAVNAVTATYRNRVKQAELLAHYQVATSTYLHQVNEGVSEATGRLVDSITSEGDTLAQMGRHREAMQYYTRALKYLTKIEPEFTLRQLRLSISLGEAMLKVNAMKDKGIHLLNTMLHKATKINATEEHRRIVDILFNAKSSSLDILGIWHKIFPK
ncbi:hypothetical protein [uncultured Duncaniella sp.]|uniref:hypothetical protein n=1 Tax=uncultured Duncaniella sp. TaxID=2768039 RepID=UPI002600AAAB|nr:hypothetical protein [uncultured Duncaniella sp.]